MNFKEYVNLFQFLCLFVFCVFVSTCITLDGSRKSDTPLSNHDPRTAVQLRTALKRLKEIMEGKEPGIHIHTFTNTFFASFVHLDTHNLNVLCFDTAVNTRLQRTF